MGRGTVGLVHGQGRLPAREFRNMASVTLGQVPVRGLNASCLLGWTGGVWLVWRVSVKLNTGGNRARVSHSLYRGPDKARVLIGQAETNQRPFELQGTFHCLHSTWIRGPALSPSSPSLRFLRCAWVFFVLSSYRLPPSMLLRLHRL